MSTGSYVPQRGTLNIFFSNTTPLIVVNCYLTLDTGISTWTPMSEDYTSMKLCLRFVLRTRNLGVFPSDPTVNWCPYIFRLNPMNQLTHRSTFVLQVYRDRRIKQRRVCRTFERFTNTVTSIHITDVYCIPT